MGANPPSGPAIRIDRVTDRRVFEINPRQANIPSLMNDDEIKDATTPDERTQKQLDLTNKQFEKRAIQDELKKRNANP